MTNERAESATERAVRADGPADFFGALAPWRGSRVRAVPVRRDDDLGALATVQSRSPKRRRRRGRGWRRRGSRRGYRCGDRLLGGARGRSCRAVAGRRARPHVAGRESRDHPASRAGGAPRGAVRSRRRRRSRSPACGPFVVRSSARRRISSGPASSTRRGKARRRSCLWACGPAWLVLDDLGQDKVSSVSAVEAVLLARHNAEAPTWITTGWAARSKACRRRSTLNTTPGSLGG